MTWIDAIADKMVDKVIGANLEKEKLFGTKNHLKKEDQAKFMVFAKKFVKRAINISIFVSVSIVSFYGYKKVGFEKTVVALLVMCFIQLIFINSHLSDANENRKA